MINDKQINALAQPLINNLIAIEVELLEWITSQFDIYESIGGSLEWKLKQLSRLGVLDQQAIKIIASGSRLSANQITKLIADAGIQSIDFSSLRKAYQLGVLDKSIDSLAFDEIIKEVTEFYNSEMSLVFREISRNVSLEYRRILDVVNLEVTQGIYGYDEALKRSLNKLADKGITAMTYQRTVVDASGNKIQVPVEYSIEGVARRTIVSAITRSGNLHNEHIARELGVDHYAVSQHLGARNKGVGHVNHESWQGKFYQISNGEFQEKTGEGLVDGLGGVNCRHVKFAYIPNVSTSLENKIKEVENEEIYALEQKQRRLERDIRNAKKQLVMAHKTGDEGYIQESRLKVREKQSIMKQYIKSHPELLRDEPREQIQKITTK